VLCLFWLGFVRSRRLIARLPALGGGSRQVLAVEVEVDEGEVGA